MDEVNTLGTLGTMDKLNKLDLSPRGTSRLVIALAALGVLGLCVRFTMDVGKYRDLTWILLAFFAFRVLLGYWRSR